MNQNNHTFNLVMYACCILEQTRNNLACEVGDETVDNAVFALKGVDVLLSQVLDRLNQPQ